MRIFRDRWRQIAQWLLVCAFVGWAAWEGVAARFGPSSAWTLWPH